MLTLCITQKDNQIIMPQEEFDIILENLRQGQDVEVILDDDPDYLTEEELQIRKEAMEELGRGETINFDDWQTDLRLREKAELKSDV